LRTSSRVCGPHPEGADPSSRGCGPHPGVADLIQGLRTPLIQVRRIVIESSVNGLFLNKYEYVFAKWFKGVEYYVEFLSFDMFED
jgi:hypothetical protein